MKNVSLYIPAVRPSGRMLTAPSGATPTRIADLQGVLVALNHAQPIAITGRMPVGSPGQLRAFQDNYNREQAARGYRYSPRLLDVDGLWGANTEAALANYIPWARQALIQRGIGATTFSQTAPGVSITPLGPSAPGTPSKAPLPGGGTDGKGGAAIQPVQQSAPQPSVAPIGPAPMIPPAASTFPVGPAIAVGVGILAIGGALYVRSRRNKKGR